MINLIAGKNPRARFQFKPTLGCLTFSELEPRFLAAPVITSGPGTYSISSQAYTGLGPYQLGIGNAAASASDTGFLDSPVDMDPFKTIASSGSVTNSYTGPQPGDPPPGTLQEAAIVVDHSHINSVTSYDHLLSEAQGGSSGTFTTASSGGTIPLIINDNNTPPNSLAGDVVTVNFTASLSAESPGFFRECTLDLRSTFLDVEIGEGLVATDSSGTIVYQDPSFNSQNPLTGSTGAAGFAQIKFDIILPDVMTTPLNVNYQSNLESGSGNSLNPTPMDFGTHTTTTELPYFNWSLSYTVSSP